MANSLPVGLGVLTYEHAVSTSRRSSMQPMSRSVSSSMVAKLIAFSPQVGEDLLGEQLDLPVALLAPQLEHDVSAAGVVVLLDRLDAVARRARDRTGLVE